MDNQSRKSQAPQHMGHLESGRFEEEEGTSPTADIWHRKTSRGPAGTISCYDLLRDEMLITAAMARL
ncbi:hypothetical protein PG991_009050 [Apiospora marii]|uniref:Uncharacterized protein n=1 Tax=Apiospora marii TaxID=335849 RepID=A0ABR1RJL5_9PEZI